jgi:hypothetical protein
MTIQEEKRGTMPGGLMFFLLLVLELGLFGAAIRELAGERNPVAGVVLVVLAGLGSILWGGFFTVSPNEAKVVQLFGRYAGSVKEAGWHWANPFLTKKRLSQRVHSFESGHLKVNDLDGNPIEIAAIAVWKVVDTAQASFAVDDHQKYVQVQSEAALRALASRYSYDPHDETHPSLRGSTAQVAEHLKVEIQERVARAGVEILEARISHLAYAPEIAQAMLQRQQAGAIIAARQRIVDGAVGMVEMALERLAKNKVVELDADRKAAMVSNLLVVLCGERATQPVINTGTIYQ